MATIRDLAGSELVYLDESGIDETIHRAHARAPRGETVSAEISGKKAQRISLLAAYSQHAFLAPMRFEGYTDTEVFNTWVEHCLVPTLTPGQTVMMDNASFHKSSQTRALIEKARCRLLYLPTYSPDLNPIEPQWAILKARIKKHRPPNQSLTDAIDYVFRTYQ